MKRALPQRSGHRPRTTPTNPHTQLEQTPHTSIVEGLVRRIFSLPGVEERPSAISVPGARALWLREEVQAGPREAFMIGREFAHIHPMPGWLSDEEAENPLPYYQGGRLLS